MESTLAWLDFNAAERERTQRVLALFEERDTRDELGLGGIRDSFSDHLFPGTSTIQTRLRYMFFVPWIYLRLERQRVPSREADRAGAEAGMHEQFCGLRRLSKYGFHSNRLLVPDSPIGLYRLPERSRVRAS